MRGLKNVKAGLRKKKKDCETLALIEGLNMKTYLFFRLEAVIFLFINKAWKTSKVSSPVEENMELKSG